MNPKPPVRSSVPDVRRVPLQQLGQAVQDGRLTPVVTGAAGRTGGVPVAAFNASL